MSSLNRSRRTLLIVLVAFLLPVIVAWIILDQHWYQAGTNKGTLLANPISLPETDALPEGWKLAYIAPQQCDSSCQSALYVMNQIDVALGKDTDRVTPVVLAASSPDATKAHTKNFTINHTRAPQLVAELDELPTDSLFIVDPLNNVMLYYPTHANREEMILEGKNVLADLRKLLKLSRIG
ncbi:MAG: hypothetical protein ACQEQZ_08395 [Pseudomonadota bacterium]